MNRISIGRYVRKNMFRYSVAGLVVCLVGVGVGAMTISNKPASFVREPSQTIQKKEPMSDNSSKNESDTPPLSSPETNQETSKPSESKAIVSSGSTVGASKPSAPSTQSPAQPSVPTVQEFEIAYLSLSSPAVYCSGGGDYYIAQIGDVNVGLRGSTGGQITYGFEVTGGIPDNWNGYRQPATVPAGVYSTSFNKLYWGNTTDPHMAYTEVIYSGHGVAAVRAVVYTPTLTYSPWVTIPAMQHGEKCS